MIDYLVWIVGVPIIVGLAVLAVRRAIALKEAIRKHFEDEASGIKDPYAAMAAVLNVQQAIDEEKRRSHQANELLRAGKKHSESKK
ncbi:MAG: hypothetical protein P4L33_10215 [Capsulimonadaceae bacterium]|nr:hypothetical protein [Capsulimonadaceae bacterium]